MEPNVDFIHSSGAEGEMAALIAGGKFDQHKMRPFVHTDGHTYVNVYRGPIHGDRNDMKNYSVERLNTYGTLRRDEWKHLDEAVIGIAETRLNGVQDLISRGLTYDLNGMMSTVLEYHDISDALSASVSMDGVTRGEGDRQVFTTNYLPLPIIHADYEFNARVLSVSRTMGQPLDTTMAERAARKVAEKIENMLFTAETYTYGGGTVYSYINHPNRNTETLSKDWADSGTTAAEILADVITMKQGLINDNFYGPYCIYIPTNVETRMDIDYVSTTSTVTTLRQRLMQVGNIEAIKVVDTLPAKQVIMVQLTSDVVRLVRGMGMQNIEWKAEGGLVSHFKVMTIQVPQIRATQAGKSGIMHGAKA